MYNVVFSNILDVMILENVKMPSNIWWSNETDLDSCHQSATYDVSCGYFKTTLISYVHGLELFNFKVFNFSEKITCFAFCLVLWIYLSACQCISFERKWSCRPIHIQCDCNHSVELVSDFFSCKLSFSHIFGTTKILSLIISCLWYTYGNIIHTTCTVWVAGYFFKHSQKTLTSWVRFVYLDFLFQGTDVAEESKNIVNLTSFNGNNQHTIHVQLSCSWSLQNLKTLYVLKTFLSPEISYTSTYTAWETTALW
jgi:hypothetical protein